MRRRLTELQRRSQSGNKHHWPSGGRPLKMLVRIDEWPKQTSVGDILCLDTKCRGRLVTTSESSHYEGGGAFQLFTVASETKRCTSCESRYQVVTFTPESQ